MGVAVSIKASPSFDKIKSLTEGIEKETLSDLRSFWILLIPFVKGVLKERFETENRGRWAALSPRYKAWKERYYPGKPILQLTQKLYHAATEKGRQGNVCEETPTSLAWGVDTDIIPYAAYVQSGVKAPSRIWCELEKQDEEDINLNFGYWLRKKLDEKCRAVK